MATLGAAVGSVLSGTTGQASHMKAEFIGRGRRTSDPGVGNNGAQFSMPSPSAELSTGYRTSASVAVSSGSLGGGGSAGSRPPRSRRSSQTFLLGETAAELSRLAEGDGGRETKPGKKPPRARRNSWTMEVADPQENYRDSFGNECAVEKKARKELEKSEGYQRVVTELNSLKDRMSDLVAKERYEDCKELVDDLNLLEFRQRVMELSTKPQMNFRVGDVIVHRRYGYRGVIYGHDPECSAPEEWQEAMKIGLLPEGRQQPFYHVLVDTRDRPGGMSTYVAQENVVLHKAGRPVLHPWIERFFVGFHDGVYIPGQKLRQVYPHDW